MSHNKSFFARLIKHVFLTVCYPQHHCIILLCYRSHQTEYFTVHTSHIPYLTHKCSLCTGSMICTLSLSSSSCCLVLECTLLCKLEGWHIFTTSLSTWFMSPFDAARWLPSLIVGAHLCGLSCHTREGCRWVIPVLVHELFVVI